MILTLDWSFSHSRDWGSPVIPNAIDARAIARFFPEVITKPQWLAQFARAGGPPGLTVPNFAVGGAPAPPFFEAYGTWMQTPPPSWEDVAWVREAWDGPFMLKLSLIHI